MHAKPIRDKIILMLVATWALIKSLSSAQKIPLNHLDGAFQTASTLIRLNRHAVIGSDFFPYLGIGPLFIHWPMFKLFGGSVSAAISTSQFLTLVLLVISLSLLLHILLEEAPVTSLAIGSLVVMISWYFRTIIFLDNDFLNAVLLPGNSLRPIRASLPYIAGWFFLMIRASGLYQFTQTLLYSFVLGACLLWSNDYALLTALVFGIGWALCGSTTVDPLPFTSNHPAKVSRRCSDHLFLAFLCRLILVLGISISSYAILLTIATNGHPIELVRYNFLDVRGDQWWYFSPYEPNKRIFNFSDITKVLMNSKYGLFLLSLGISPIAVLIMFCHSRVTLKSMKNLSVFALVGLTLLFGGLLSCIGGHYSPGYIFYFAFWGLSSSLILFYAIFRRSGIDGSKNYSRSKHIIARLAEFAVLPLAIGAVFIEGAKGLAQRTRLFNQPDYAYVSALGGFIPQEYRQVLESLRPSIKQGGIQEEYFGLTSAYHDRHGYYPVDSLIHLLGSLRKSNQSRALPEIVIVTNPTYSLWQSWSLSQNWWFYKKIIGSHELYKSLPTVDVYKRKTGLFSLPPLKKINCRWVASESSLVFDPVVHPGLYSVSIKYKPMEGRGLLLIQNRISMPSDAHGYVSLDPLAGASEFPVALAGGPHEKLGVKVLGNFHNQRFVIGQCHAARVATFRHRFLLGSYSHRTAGNPK